MPAAAAACSALLRLELDSIRLVSRSPKFLLRLFWEVLFIFLFVVGLLSRGRREEAESICLFH
jgi:hypothetical protein